MSRTLDLLLTGVSAAKVLSADFVRLSRPPRIASTWRSLAPPLADVCRALEVSAAIDYRW